MINYREIIRLRCSHYSFSKIAASLHHSRNKVSEVCALADKHKLMKWPLSNKWTDAKLFESFYPERASRIQHKMPDYEYIHKEMAKTGVNLTLLWSEYCLQCESDQSIPYQYTQFCEHYKRFVMKTKATMRIKRKPAEVLEVDWAGTPMHLTDKITGEPYPVYIFVATLSCSLYSYAKACSSMNSENWIMAHLETFDYFGGTTRILVPDNLKTGVVKHSKDELILNKVYQEMAQHYDMAVIPARTAKPKDKPNAEKSIGIVTTWIIAALRNRKFFTIEELNQAIAEKLEEFNSKPFQKRKGSRKMAFLQEEKEYLKPLPASRYELAVWSTATIQTDYLITVDKIKYSVPYEFIGKKVDIRTTTTTIEVFFHNHRIASHVKRYGIGDPVILPEHMPEKHREYLAYTSENFVDWAKAIGESTTIVIKSFLGANKYEKQGFSSCKSLMKLADRYSTKRIENACFRALSYTPTPSIKNIRAILKSGQDKVKTSNRQAMKSSDKYGFTRGANYFAGGESDD
jgi:transposase